MQDATPFTKRQGGKDGKYRLPAIYPQKEYLDEGGIMSYGVDVSDQYRRVAYFVDKS
jgi:hypothetical protein